MNLESILPLLAKDSNPQTAALLSALSGGGDTSKLIESLMAGDTQNKELLSVLSMMQNGQKKPPNASSEGLKAIHNFAPTDILGVMVKHYTKK